MKSVVGIIKAATVLMALVLLAAGSGWAQSEEQQSLGDVARKQKAKEGKESKPAKVFSNEDLPHSPDDSPSQPAASSAGGTQQEQGDTAAAAKKEAPAGEGEQGSENKAAAAAEAQRKMDTLKADEGAYHRGIERFEQMIANETDESRKELYRHALQTAQQRLAENMQKQAEAQKDLDAKQAAAKEEQQQSPPPPQPEQPPQ